MCFNVRRPARPFAPAVQTFVLSGAGRRPASAAMVMTQSACTWSSFSLLLMVLPWMPFCQAGPPEALITSLPGQPNVSFAQYAGYITIDAAAGRSFFYYFAEAEDPSAKPLTLWLNGGPGCSSVGYGAFTENGPFRACATNGELIEFAFSWNKASNMLYLDSPAGVGWSYSNASADHFANDSSTAEDNFVFLQSWFESFPEYKGREFYITGESYAGHYVPQLTSLIVDYIAEKGTSVINLIGIAIGNPLLDGEVDFPEEIFFLWSHALISDDAYKNVIENCNSSILDPHTEECSAAYSEVDRQVSEYTDPYDVLIDVCLSPSVQQAYKLKQKHVQKRLQKSRISSGPLDICIADELTAYMNLPEVQQALHANVTGLSYTWTYCSEESLDYDQSNAYDSMLPVLSHILEHGVSVLVFSGDEDSVIPFSGTRRLVNQLASMNGLNTSIPYSAWFDGGQIGGWTQVYGTLSYATVRGAAHTVPYSSPGRGLTLFQSFLAGTSMPLSSPSQQHQTA